MTAYPFIKHPTRDRRRRGVLRCCACGRFVGNTFTGFDRDRLAARGRVFCDACATRPPEGRP